MSNTNSLLEIDNLVVKKRRFSPSYDLEDRAGTKLGEAFPLFRGFPIFPKFVVTDASGSEVMHIEQTRVSLPDQFTFYDPSGAELGTIQRKLAKTYGRGMFRISIGISFFEKEEFWVEKDSVESMRIYVDSLKRNYKMQVRGFQVASAYKHIRAFRPEQLEISITGGVDHRVIIGAVIVIEFLNAITPRAH